MNSRRRLMELALRRPMQAIGWRPRVAGWFTCSIAPEHTGAIAVSAGSGHAPPGASHAQLYVHMRREDVEPVVRKLTEATHKDGGYRSVTATTSIGYLMPERAWREWLFTEDTVDAVAAELAAGTEDYARPYLDRLAADPQTLLDAVRDSPLWLTPHGLCQEVVLLMRMQRPQEARAVLEQRLNALGERTNSGTEREPAIIDRLQRWLDALA